MEIRENDKLCIFTPLCKILNKQECIRLFNIIEKDSRKIAIDLSYVNECTIDFIEKIKNFPTNKRLGIFNIPSDVFVLFNTMKVDKSANLYVSELDFIENSRQLLNRDFSLVS